MKYRIQHAIDRISSWEWARFQSEIIRFFQEWKSWVKRIQKKLHIVYIEVLSSYYPQKSMKFSTHWQWASLGNVSQCTRDANKWGNCWNHISLELFSMVLWCINIQEIPERNFSNHTFPPGIVFLQANMHIYAQMEFLLWSHVTFSCFSTSTFLTFSSVASKPLTSWGHLPIPWTLQCIFIEIFRLF